MVAEPVENTAGIIVPLLSVLTVPLMETVFPDTLSKLAPPTVTVPLLVPIAIVPSLLLVVIVVVPLVCSVIVLDPVILLIVPFALYVPTEALELMVPIVPVV